MNSMTPLHILYIPKLTPEFPAFPLFCYAVLYTIEFQKRGLPHCHTLLWISSSTKVQDATDIDQYISAELPDPVDDPSAYKIVSEMMVHGPCGTANLNAPCMEGQVCTKKFPKKYN